MERRKFKLTGRHGSRVDQELSESIPLSHSPANWMSGNTDLELLVTDDVRIEMEDKGGRPLSPKKLSAAQTDDCKVRNLMLRATKRLLTFVLFLFRLKKEALMAKMLKNLCLRKWRWWRRCSCLRYVGNIGSGRCETHEIAAMEVESLVSKI